MTSGTPGMSAERPGAEHVTDASQDDSRDFKFRTFKIRYPVHSGDLPSSSNSHDSTGFTLWTNALTAAVAALDDQPDLVCARRVAEVGCGLGILGLVCRELGARTVALTDQNDAALQMAARTISMNPIPDVRTAVWDWGKTKPPGNVEFVVGSDVIFSSAAARQLASDLVDLKVNFLIGHQKRRAVYRDPETKEIKTEEEDSALRTFISELAPIFRIDVVDVDNDCCVIKGCLERSRKSMKRGRSASMDDDPDSIRSPRRRGMHPGSNAFSDAVAVAFMATSLHEKMQSRSPPSSSPSSPDDEGEMKD